VQAHLGLTGKTMSDGWPVTGKQQTFENVPVDVNVNITEGHNTFSTYHLTRVDFTKKGPGLIRCSPAHVTVRSEK